MKSRSAPFGILDRAEESRLFEEIPRPDRTVDSRDFLVHYAAGADVHVADFGVSHQTGGQTDVLAGGVDPCPGVGRKQKIDVGLPCLGDGVDGGVGPQTEAVEDYKNNLLSDLHRRISGLVYRRTLRRDGGRLRTGIRY